MRYGISPYIRLMRLDKPVGIWLLLWPCCWSLALHGAGLDVRLLALFGAGAVVMRAAGCIINDLTDRKLDAQVERTRTRPLASGELSVRAALILLAMLVAIATLIAFALGIKVVIWSAASLPLIIAYPWMKRITWWPQLFLGLTFNWGALVAAVAATGDITPQALWLYAGCVFWTLGYDTIYAHQDKQDDEKIGIKSTALRLGGQGKKFVALCYVAAAILWAVANANIDAGFAAILLCAGFMLLTLRRVELENAASCSRAFSTNIIVGWLFFAGLIMSQTRALPY